MDFMVFEGDGRKEGSVAHNGVHICLENRESCWNKEHKRHWIVEFTTRVVSYFVAKTAHQAHKVRARQLHSSTRASCHYASASVCVSATDSIHQHMSAGAVWGTSAKVCTLLPSPPNHPPTHAVVEPVHMLSWCLTGTLGGTGKNVKRRGAASVVSGDEGWDGENRDGTCLRRSTTITHRCYSA